MSFPLAGESLRLQAREHVNTGDLMQSFNIQTTLLKRSPKRPDQHNKD